MHLQLTNHDVHRAQSPPPDWNLVPFEVSCARCGHDLRGLSKPACPACDLEFDWSVAVPIKELTCLKCDYHLFGLRETRCPECGTSFTWQNALAAYHRRERLLFEYRWETKPVRSLMRTWWMGIRPKRFWSRLDIHDPPQVKPLIFVLAALLFGFVFTAALGLAVHDWLLSIWNARSWKPPPRSVFEIPLLALKALADRSLLHIFEIAGLWVLISLLSLLIYQQSMRRCRIRFVHVFRVFVYAIPLLLAITPVIIVSGSLANQRVGGLESNSVILIVLSLLFGFVLWSIRCAYAFYLRIPHGAAIALVSQTMSLLLLVLMLSFTQGVWIGRLALKAGF